MKTLALVALVVALTACAGSATFEEETAAPVVAKPQIMTPAPMVTPTPELPPAQPTSTTAPIVVNLSGGTTLTAAPTLSTCIDRSKSARLVYDFPLADAREIWVAPKIDYTVEHRADAAIVTQDNTRCTERGEAWVSWWTDTNKEEIPAPASPGVSQGAPTGSRMLYISVAARGNTTLTVRSVGGTVRYER